MTNDDLEAMKKAFADQAAFIERFPHCARLQLVSNGIYRMNGQLHEYYGGPEMTAEERAQHEQDVIEADKILDLYRDVVASRAFLDGEGI